MKQAGLVDYVTKRMIEMGKELSALITDDYLSVYLLVYLLEICKQYNIRLIMTSTCSCIMTCLQDEH